MVSPLIINLYLHSESHFIPDPEIDTIFTEKFTKEGFNSLKIGSPVAEVLVLLGEPKKNYPFLNIVDRISFEIKSANAFLEAVVGPKDPKL